MIRLARNKQGQWGVYSVNGSIEFNTIELAADYLINKLNVKDDEIDQALIEMYAYNMAVSVFNETGDFTHTADM